MIRQFPRWFMIVCGNVLMISLLTVTLVPVQAKVVATTEQKKDLFLHPLTSVLIPKCIKSMRSFFPKEWVLIRNQVVANASTKYKNSPSSQSLQKMLSSESCRAVIAQLNNTMKVSKNATMASNKQLYAEAITISVSYFAYVIVIWIIGACALNETCQSFVTNQILGTLQLTKTVLDQVGEQVKDRLQRYNQSGGKTLPSYNEYSTSANQTKYGESSCNQVDVQSLKNLKDNITGLENDLGDRQRTNHKKLQQSGNDLAHRINDAFKNIITRHHQKYAPSESAQSAIAKWTQSPKNGSHFTPKETKQMAEKFREFVKEPSMYTKTIQEMKPSTSWSHPIFSLAAYFFDVSVEILSYFVGFESISNEVARLKKEVHSMSNDVIVGNCTKNTVQKIKQYENQYRQLSDLNRINRMKLHRANDLLKKLSNFFMQIFSSSGRHPFVMATGTQNNRNVEATQQPIKRIAIV